MRSLSIRSLGLTLTALLAVVTVGAASAPAATYTWGGGSGNWNEPGHWISQPANPGTIPSPTDDVVIPGPGTFTVTINSNAGALYGARSLTLGDNAMGSQQLLIKTDANTAYGSGLTLAQPSTIAPHGQVTIDQDPSTPAGSNQPYITFNADSVNQGTILARVQATGGSGTDISGRGFLTNTGTLHVQNGRLTTKGIVNTGSIVVDAGAQLHTTTIGDQSGGVTQNGGTISNNGEFVADGRTWNQNGGTLTGNPVHIVSTGFVDAAGTGAFRLTGSITLAGTIPAGQTVAIGDRAVEESTYIHVQPGLTVAPGATLIAQGPPANGLGFLDNPVTVNGTMRVAMPRTATSGGNDRTQMGGGLTVGAGGVLDVQADSILSLGSGSAVPPAYSSNGAVSIGPGAEVWLQQETPGVFTNGPGSSLSFGIASPTRFGKIRGLFSPIALGGSATGVLDPGYVPAVGTAFKVVEATVAGGSWASVGGGFTASYAADKTSASLVYGAPSDGGNPPGGGGGGGTPPGGGTTPPDRTAPVVRGVRIAGTSVRFTSTEAGTAKLTITRTVTGRKVKGRCVARTHANAKRSRCTRTITVATRKAKIAAGAGSVALPKLRVGHYQARLVVTDAAGNVAKTVSKALVVKATPKKKGKKHP